jgi:hypothetical protein
MLATPDRVYVHVSETFHENRLPAVLREPYNIWIRSSRGLYINIDGRSGPGFQSAAPPVFATLRPAKQGQEANLVLAGPKKALFLADFQGVAHKKPHKICTKRYFSTA